MKGFDWCCCGLLVLKKIGEGSSAIVYQIFDRAKYGEIPLCVALKVYKEPDDSVKEYKILKDIEHKNIIRCLGSPIDVGNTRCLMFELMTKGTLKQLSPPPKSNRKGLKESERKSCMRQVVEGLVYLHSRETTHGDIKCSNILQGKGGICKLADFVWARKVIPQVLSEADDVIHSPQHQAPEVYEKGYSSASDIYSLGCTTLEMYGALYGNNIQNELQVYGRIPVVPDWLPEDAQTFIKACLKREPEERPEAVDLLKYEYLRVPTSCPDLSFDSSLELSSKKDEYRDAPVPTTSPDKSSDFTSVTSSSFSHHQGIPGFMLPLDVGDAHTSDSVGLSLEERHTDDCCTVFLAKLRDPTGKSERIGILDHDTISVVLNAPYHNAKDGTRQGINCKRECVLNLQKISSSI